MATWARSSELNITVGLPMLSFQVKKKTVNFYFFSPIIIHNFDKREKKKKTGLVFARDSKGKNLLCYC